jgi:O-antigen chain-terminating methyltransferase
MRPETNKDEKLLDSAAKAFRNRLPAASRFQGLADSGPVEVAAAPGPPYAALERGEVIDLPHTLRLARSLESAAPQIGDMPPEPPTMRGRVGGALVQAVRRALFWYTGQIRAFQGLVAEAAGEHVTALRELDARQQRQEALLPEVLRRLGDLEQEREQTATAFDEKMNRQAEAIGRHEQMLVRQEDKIGGQEDKIRLQDTRIGLLETQMRDLRKAQEEWQDEVQAKVAAVEQTFSASLARIDEALAGIRTVVATEGKEVRGEMHQEIEREIHKIRSRLLQHESRLRLLLMETRKGSAEHGSARAAEDIAHIDDAFLVDHAGAFRGTRAEIKSRLAVYQPFVRDAFAAATGAPALDLGCGRGEWLELLRSMEIPASGIDWNSELVRTCCEMGLDARQGDILRILDTIPDESLSIVTAFHFIEHVSFSDLLTVIDHALRVLRPGGIAIFETPNPGNVFVGSRNFYLDPTHRHPIPSELLAFMVESRGFCDLKVLPLSPYPDHFHLPGSECAAVQFINEHFYGPQDYGIVALKA